MSQHSAVDGFSERSHLGETGGYDSERGLHHGPIYERSFNIGDVGVVCVQYYHNSATMRLASNLERFTRKSFIIDNELSDASDHRQCS